MGIPLRNLPPIESMGAVFAGSPAAIQRDAMKQGGPQQTGSGPSKPSNR